MYYFRNTHTTYPRIGLNYWWSSSEKEQYHQASLSACQHQHHNNQHHHRDENNHWPLLEHSPRTMIIANPHCWKAIYSSALSLATPPPPPASSVLSLSFPLPKNKILHPHHPHIQPAKLKWDLWLEKSLDKYIFGVAPSFSFLISQSHTHQSSFLTTVSHSVRKCMMGQWSEKTPFHLK